MRENIIENREKAIIYCRVSTDEQAKYGYSLKDQKEVCLNYARSKNLDVVEVFVEEGKSAKTIRRPKLMEILDFIKKNEVLYLIVKSYDRLSRDTKGYFDLLDIFNRRGILLESVLQPFVDNADGKFNRNMSIVNAQHENDIRSERTTSGMKQAVKSGRWLHRPPFGYSLEEKDGRSFLIQNRDAKTVGEIFELYNRGHRVHEIRKLLEKKEINLSKQTIGKILRNPLYKGKIRIKGWFGGEEIEGAHKPIIDETTFDMIQESLNRKNVMKNKKLRIHPAFPLRGVLFCPKCNSKLTASFSTGRQGKQYGYYHCTIKGCTFKHLKKELVEEAFISFINTLRPNDRLIDLFSEIIKDVYHKRNTALEENIKKWDKDVLKIDDDIGHIISMHQDGLIENEDFKKRYQALRQRKRNLEYKITETIAEVENIDEYLVFGERLIRDLPDFWIKSPVEHKDILQKLMFPEGITFDGERFGTTKIATIFNVFQGKNIDESTMVAHRGLEPLFLP